MESIISEKAKRTSDPAISYLLQIALETPGMISLAAGLVDQESLPSQEVERLLHHVQKDPGCRQQSLQYGTTGGLGNLREAIIDLLRKADDGAKLDVALNDCKVSELLGD